MTTNGREFSYRSSQGIFLFYTAFRLALVPHPVSYGSGTGEYFAGVSRPMREANHSTPCVEKVKEYAGCCFRSHKRVSVSRYLINRWHLYMRVLCCTKNSVLVAFYLVQTRGGINDFYISQKGLDP